MTGTWQDFEGDDALTGFDKLVAIILLKNELGGLSNGYELAHSTGSSGYSFGGNQMDLSVNIIGQDLLRDILTNATDENDNLIFLDGDQFYDDHQAEIESSGDPDALSSNDIELINQALNSDYGRLAINTAFVQELDGAIDHVDSIINSLSTGNIKTTLQNSQELRAILVDYHNQFSLNTGGPMHEYLQGMEVTTYQNNDIQLDGMITAEDLHTFMSQTLWATNNPTAFGTRQDNIQDTFEELEIGKYLSGNGGNQNYTGTQFDDSILGNDGDDTLNGGGGVDTVLGGDGNDTLIFNVSQNSFFAPSDEILDGGADTDTLRIELTSGQLTNALKDEILDLYNNWTNVNTSPEKEYDFDILKLHVYGFENLDVKVDGVSANLVTLAKNDEFMLLQNGNMSGNLFVNNGSGADYTFGSSLTATAGSFATISGGTISISSDGSFAFTALASYKGVDSYTYTVTDTAGITLTATAYFNVQQAITGTTSNDSVNYNNSLNPISYNGGLGNDTISGSNYGDLLIGGDGTDTIGGYYGNDVIYGGIGNDTLRGSFGADVVYGEDGNDFIGQSEAADTYADIYYGGAGGDFIYFNGGGDTGFGGDGADVFTGSSGSDIAFGEAGNDTFYDDNGGNDFYYGGADNDTFHLNTGNDYLDGGDGIDTIIIQIATAGITINLSSVIAQYTDPYSYTDTVTNIENIRATAYADILTGNSVANDIMGNGGNDIIYGLAGDDILNGGSGNDTLYGGEGNDQYSVDSALDVVTENANEGSDTIQTTVSFTLSANIENLTLLGSSSGITLTGNSLDNLITGSNAANTLYGGDGNDTLNGGAGNDTMYGGVGNDIYYMDTISDAANENANEGIDIVYSSVTKTLSTNVEHLYLTGTAIAHGTGNDLANIINGNSNTNSLNGGNGNDTLNGQGGADTLTGGANSDTFLFDDDTAFSGIDTISDYNVSQGDAINIADLLSGYTAGVSNINDFCSISTSGGNSLLYVDRDGSGSTYSSQQIVTLSGVTGLDVDDLLLNNNLIAV